ncbi:S8 family serine peptidase, partial [Flavobacteriaceae bacterium]|nr:S8 family serine peptidase [Flavobacteriaceae bacterium]
DNPNVEYAEPNYIYGIDDFEVGETITAEQAAKMESSLLIDVDDPLYPTQSNITTTNIDDVWEQYTTGDGSQVIAILDTGGDYTHPDLEANTWINEAELNGVAGFDDDGNGYIDDIRGWDFINQDNAPLDDNMHGTHVAGIAGAVGNNGIGIAGAAWNVKLMHIKVFQSTGQGTATTIADGVEYASSNGAGIINMSFGSYAESSTLKLALENAYATSILVAAAGNDGYCIGPVGSCPPLIIVAPMFPGAYSFVLGVEDSVGQYDNFDNDGPINTAYGINSLLNYELKAPGSAIMSTVPGGGYAPLTGTSMATPLVAGGLALYNEQKPDDSIEIMFGNLINTSNIDIDLLAAISVEPAPELAVLSSVQRDTISGQNGNGFWEPGETIEILPLVRNYWGPTDDVRVGIEFAEFEDQTKATIVQDEIQIGSISAYATLQDLEETLKITLADDIANNVDIRFNLTVWSGPDQEYMSEPTEIVINVKNSILFYGYISEDVTLTPDKEYLVTENVIVNDDAVITILPGTILRFSDGISMSFQGNSRLIANGTKEDRIKILPEQNGQGYLGFKFQSKEIPAWHTMKFIEFNGVYSSPTSFLYNSSGYLLEDAIIQDGYVENSITHNPHWTCLIRRVNYTNLIVYSTTIRDYEVIEQMDDNKFNEYIESYGDNINYSPSIYENNPWVYLFQDINYINNKRTAHWNPSDQLLVTGGDGTDNYSSKPFLSWNAFGNYDDYASVTLGGRTYGENTVFQPALYLGSSDSEVIDNQTHHYLGNNNPFSGYTVQVVFEFSQTPVVPFEGAHGIVWKVEVNGYDAQDEYASLDALGVGTHEFKVYFNREMDTSVDPQISYGVTIPYNQKIIPEEGTWSPDGKIYTVNHEINIGAADGINRIRVQEAQDLDYFKIPVEDSRFNFLLQSAGSASSGFFAAGGLGKIDLEWLAPSADDIDDVLGYNMYRYQIDADGVESDPVKLNETLIIEDTDDSTTGVYFSDYAVLEGETYFYKYKILRTSFEETDYSNTVVSSPLTSTLGDSNGDFDVNVLDLV